MTSFFVVVYVAPSCGPPTPVYCDVIGCVHVTAVCLGLVTCPNVILAHLCSNNGNLRVLCLSVDINFVSINACLDVDIIFVSINACLDVVIMFF